MVKKTGYKLSDRFKLIDKPLFFACLILLVFGLLNIVTASSREAATWEYGIYHFFFQHLKMIGFGVLAFIVVMRLPTKNYNRMIVLGWVILIVLILYTIFYGEAHRGSNRWINIEGFRFQPGDFAKPVVVVITAVLFEKYTRLIKRKPIEARKIINMAIIFCLSLAIAVFLQRDFGNAFIIGTIFLALFLAGPMDWQLKFKYIGALFVVGFVLISVFLLGGGKIFQSYQIKRLDFLKPCTKYEVTGYQICNGYIAINEGGLFGVGIGNSRQKYSYIDEPHTDMVFAIIIEEYGALFAGFLFSIYTLIMIRMIKISNAAKKLKLKYMAYGVMIYTFMQILINLGGLFGLMPFTGVILPFFSYGGSFTIAYLASIALVLRVSYENKQEKIKIKKN